ncbi:MAG: 23S rRNA (adenine(1618)-N(6))-methyltransferase RlmF [Crocinitomicaceae bacterium]
MSSEKNKLIKSKLHPRNKNRNQYDFDALIIASPELKKYVLQSKRGVLSIDFSKATSVKALNKAILNYYYDIKFWDFPDENLCPPIPGRADYIHHIADLLAESNFGSIPIGDKINCLDVGTGASCIYPIIGTVEYGWDFIGSDINEKSIASARSITNRNSRLVDKIEIRLQRNSNNIFKGILKRTDKIDAVICNPPFHSSIEDAQKGSRRKVKNLSGKEAEWPKLNFSGSSNELVYVGGEYQFIHTMIMESAKVSNKCLWFSTLVSKQSNLKGIYKTLEKINVKHVKTIPMGTGNKITRIVAWTFLSVEEQLAWRKMK